MHSQALNSIPLKWQDKPPDLEQPVLQKAARVLPGDSLRVWVAKSVEDDRQRSHGGRLRGPKVVGGGRGHQAFPVHSGLSRGPCAVGKSRRCPRPDPRPSRTRPAALDGPPSLHATLSPSRTGDHDRICLTGSQREIS